MKSKSFTYIYLEDSFKEKGCPVCNVVDKYVKRYLDNFLYENVNSPSVRIQLRQTLGFCNQHAWQVAKVKDGLGISIVYEDLLETVLNNFNTYLKNNTTVVKSKKSLTSKNNLLAELINQKNNCPACKLSNEVEQNCILLILENIKEPSFNRLYKNSTGLCLKHLKLLIDMSYDPKITQEILDIEKNNISKIISELQEYQRKHDYRFSHETFGEEKDSWLRAIEKVVGKNYL